jgi:hypothetical protein
MTKLEKIELSGAEEWREYDFQGRIYRIENPVSVQFRIGGDTHRITDSAGVAHLVPAPGKSGCVVRWKGRVIA